jgi:Kef-type K+ transport system membrane component KefB
MLLLVLAGFMHAARSFTEAGAAPHPGTALAFGYIALSAYLAGQLFRQARLPQLTGYLVLGLVAGPQGLSLLTEPMVHSLGLVNGAAISLIALSAGVEIELGAMRPLLRSLAWISLAVVATAGVLAAVCLAFEGALGFLREMPASQAAAVSLVLGVVTVAQSPAVVVALRSETRAEGPVMRTVLAVVVLADLLVIVLFAVTSALAKAAFGTEGALGVALATIAWKVLGSAAGGGVMGALIATYLAKVRSSAALFVLTTCVVMAEVGGRLDLDPLLAALVAGMLIRNTTSAHQGLGQAIAASALPVYALFFAVAGARIHLDLLTPLAVPLLVLWLVRSVGLVGGTWFAARMAGAPPAVGRYAGWGLVPQAGLALALAVLFVDLFPEFGDQAAALTMGMVAVNELIGPVLFRMALVRSGEVGQLAAQPSVPATDKQDGAGSR